MTHGVCDSAPYGQPFKKQLDVNGNQQVNQSYCKKKKIDTFSAWYEPPNHHFNTLFA